MATVNEWTFEELKKLYYLREELGWDLPRCSVSLGRTYEATKTKWQRNDWAEFATFITLDDRRRYEDEIESDDTDHAEAFVTTEVAKLKSKQTESNDLRIYNELLRKNATTERIIEKVCDVVKSLEPLNPVNFAVKKSAVTGTEEVAVLCLGDLHVGLRVAPTEVGGLGNYGIEIFKKDMELLFDSAYEIVELHRKAYPVRTLHILGLGDFVHGMNEVGAWGHLHLETDIMGQVFTCMQYVEAFISKCSRVFDEVKMDCVYGNHGRMSKKGVEKEHVNWDYMIYYMLRKALSNHKNVTINFDESWFRVVEILGKKFMLVHGDDIKSWAGIPFYGVQRTEGRYRALFEQFKNVPEAYQACLPSIEKLQKNPNDNKVAMECIESVMRYAKTFDYLVMAHFHTPAEFTTNSGGKIIINGPLFGGDDYSLKVLQSAMPPCQKMFGVHPRRGITWRYDIDLRPSKV